MIPRAICEQLFREAIAACDPALRVREAIARLELRPTLGLAIGKAALAMARGAGPIGRGLAITNADDARPLPDGWMRIVASHPEPDERSLAAGDAAIAVIASAIARDRVLVLISGGASALCERPALGVTLDQIRGEVAALAASGATIREINERRVQLSAIKGGKLAAMCAAPITTLAASDVIGDDPAVIGSGPTFPLRRGDRVEVVEPMSYFAKTLAARAEGRLPGVTLGAPPYISDVALHAASFANWPSVRIEWGEPTVVIPPDHGEGGRSQQLALGIAQHIRGLDRSAFVAGSDGVDGPPPYGRPAPAGAYVDGTTWDAIAAAGIDPAAALARCDAGTALHAVGALVVTGPTGINHADIAIVG